MFEELKEQYRQALPDKIAAIRSLLQDVRDGNKSAIERLRHMAHTLHGSGSTFGFPDISTAARRVEQAGDDDLLKELAHLIRVLVAVAAIEEETERPAILLIDDDADITRLIQVLLAQKCPDHQVIVTANAAEATPWVNMRGFDLILLDLLLPDSDGRHILKLLRESRHRDTPVFVLSVVNKEAVRDECLALGADKFYIKPFRPAEIVDAIASAVTGVKAATATASPPPAQQPAVVPSAPAKTRPTLPVLVAEDDELLVNVIRHRLTREGLQVEHVSNGAAALAALEQKAFCLVILDVKMPMMDGFEVLTKVRQRYDKSMLPIIMLTAMGSEKDVVRGYDLGASDYMLKPFSPTELVAKVKSQLQLA